MYNVAAGQRYSKRAASASILGPCSAQITAWLVAYQSQNDNAALRKLVMSLLPRIRGMAKRVNPRFVDDLTAEGAIALISVAKRHMPRGELPFMAHALPAIRGAMVQANSKLISVLSVPGRALRDAHSGRLSGERAEELLRSLVLEDFDEMTAGAGGLAAEELSLNEERRRILRRAVATALRALSREERRMVVQHVLHEEKTLELLADELGLPLTRARMIEGRALHKMRNSLMQNGFELSDLV